MADNYLEKQMEDYRAGRLGKHTVGAAGRSDRRKVFVAVSCDRLAEVVAGLRSKADIYVAFTGMPWREGNLLAQCTGAQFIPLSERCPDIDSAILLAESMKGLMDEVVCDAKNASGIAVDRVKTII